MTDTWTWATVTQASPLRIKVDGDTSALDATTDNLVGSLAVDDRVRVHLHSDGIIVTGLQGGGNRSNPNLLINSNFMVNQREAVSGATVADGAHFLDQWKNSYVSPTSVIYWADSAGVRTITLGYSGGARSIAQLIESQNTRAGSHTLSWSGTATGRIYNSGAAAPAYAASPITVTLDGAANGVVEFQGNGGTLADVKVESGTLATPYQPPPYAENLRACRRFYWRLTAVTGGAYSRMAQGFAMSTTVVAVMVSPPVPMRAIPTVTTSGSLGVYDGSTSIKGLTALVRSESGIDTIQLLCTTTGLTQFRPYQLLAYGDIDAFVAFDAGL